MLKELPESYLPDEQDLELYYRMQSHEKKQDQSNSQLNTSNQESAMHKHDSILSLTVDPSNNPVNNESTQNLINVTDFAKSATNAALSAGDSSV